MKNCLCELGLATLILAGGWVSASGNTRQATARDLLIVSSPLTAGDRTKLDWDISLLALGGGSPRRLLRTAADEFDPALSPDRSHIVFAALAEPTAQSTDIWVMNSTGSHRVQLTHFAKGVLASSPTWSTDRKHIAFATVATKAHVERIHIMSADGTRSRVVADGISPVWSPVADQLLFLQSPGTVAVLDLATGKKSVVLPGAEAEAAAWSPDGRRIAYCVWARGTVGSGRLTSEVDAERIYTVDARKGNRRFVTQTLGRVVSLVWPTLDTIAYTAYTSDGLGFPLNPVIWSVGVTGHRRRALTSSSTYSFTSGGYFGVMAAFVTMELLQHRAGTGALPPRVN